MKLTKAMKERAKCWGAEWKDEGDGYASLVGYNSLGFMSVHVAYIALPSDHPAVNGSYDDYEPSVNGGLTFSDGNVYGWDYMHAYNSGSPETDIPAAIDYFRNNA